MNSAHAIYCGMRAFFVFGGEEAQVRQAARGDASPSGDKRRRKSARRPCGFAIRRQKRFDRFFADLQSAAVGFSCLL